MFVAKDSDDDLVTVMIAVLLFLIDCRMTY